MLMIHIILISGRDYNLTFARFLSTFYWVDTLIVSLHYLWLFRWNFLKPQKWNTTELNSFLFFSVRQRRINGISFLWFHYLTLLIYHPFGVEKRGRTDFFP